MWYRFKPQSSLDDVQVPSPARSSPSSAPLDSYTENHGPRPSNIPTLSEHRRCCTSHQFRSSCSQRYLHPQRTIQGSPASSFSFPPSTSKCKLTRWHSQVDLCRTSGPTKECIEVRPSTPSSDRVADVGSTLSSRSNKTRRYNNT